MYSMGIDVGGTNLRVGVINPEGDLILSFKENTPTTSMEDFFQVLENLVARVRGEIQQPLAGLGIGWPGTVDFHQGMVLETPNIKTFKNFPLKAELEKRLKMKCFLDNDAKCAGYAEKKFGVAQEFSDFLLLTFGTGIGGVIFANSQVVYGKSGSAGEIGHLCIHPKGRPCPCGCFGCFEQYCSAKALEKRAFEIFHQEFSARDILKLSEEKSEMKKLIADYVEDMTIALNSLVYIFDPQAIVFSGGLFTTGGGPLLSQIEENLKNQGFKSMKKDLKLLASELEGKAGIIGAACLALN